jgi:hypothetical protein
MSWSWNTSICAYFAFCPSGIAIAIVFTETWFWNTNVGLGFIQFACLPVLTIAIHVASSRKEVASFIVWIAFLP